MSISRIDKMIFESSDSQTLAQSTERRGLTLQIVVGDDSSSKTAKLAHAAISVALRSLTGAIHIFYGNTSSSDGLKPLAEELLEIEKEFDGGNRVKIMAGTPDPNLASIALGHVNDGIKLTADASGWISSINKSMPANTQAEAPAIAFAVACIFSKFFKIYILRKTTPAESWSIDLLKLDVNPISIPNYIPHSISIGTVGLLGAGAIGGAFCYILSLTNWTGVLDIIDSQAYEEPNHETTLLISRKDVLEGPKKAERISDIVNQSKSLFATPHIEYMDAKSELLKIKRNIFICAVDNSPTRRNIDQVNSEILINSGVGGTALDSGHVLLTQHNEENSLLSTFYPENNNKTSSSEKVSSQFKDECSRLNYESVSLAAPFIALASGALLAASCARHSLKIKTVSNYFKIDLFGMQQAIDIRAIKNKSTVEQVTAPDKAESL